MKEVIAKFFLLLALLNGKLSADLFKDDNTKNPHSFNQLIVDDDKIFVVTSQEKYDCISVFDLNGKRLWENRVDVAILSWDLTDKYLLVQSKSRFSKHVFDQAFLICFDRFNGKELWSEKIGR